MPGSNNGTGRPLTFRCSICRRNKVHAAHGYANRIQLTGKKKSSPTNCGCRNDEWAREYICTDCGHRGWSRHTDLMYLERITPDNVD